MQNNKRTGIYEMLRNILSLRNERRLFYKITEVVKNYPVSLKGFRYKKLFENVEIFCMFIGYSRSGHSMVGSLLDAHPDIIIAHELGVLKYLLTGFKKIQIYYLLLENSRTAAKRTRKEGGYLYHVQGQWQGKFKNLRIIGDKHGEGTTLLMGKTWLRLRDLRNTMGNRIKFLHVIRNPYDTIATMAKKTYNMNLIKAAERYFSLCETNAEIIKQLDISELFELKYEDFIENPKNLLKDICFFLGADATEDYLNDCASIVFKSPRKTRFDASWNPKLIEMVKEKMSRFPFLNGYSYDK